MDVLWLTPDKPENISVGRQRIANQLRDAGHNVVVRGTTRETVATSLRERGAYDAVVGVTRMGAFAGLLVSTVHRIPLIVDHIDPIRQFAETDSRLLAPFVALAENLTFRLADHVLYVYDEERPRVERYSNAATKTDLGVDFDLISNPSPEVVERATDELLPSDLRANVAVYIGGLEPLYNIESLLAAVDHLDDWSLVIAGAGSLEDRVSERADGDQVVFLGAVEHELIPGLLSAADVGVSLVDDPHTLKVLEYGAAGLSVVQLRGRSESRFGEHVSYCRPTAESIADAIRTAHDSRDAGLQSYVEQFDWGAIAETYEETLVRAVRTRADQR